jgi:hypothetical protein
MRAATYLANVPSSKGIGGDVQVHCRSEREEEMVMM